MKERVITFINQLGKKVKFSRVINAGRKPPTVAFIATGLVIVIIVGVLIATNSIFSTTAKNTLLTANSKVTNGATSSLAISPRLATSSTTSPTTTTAPTSTTIPGTTTSTTTPSITTTTSPPINDIPGSVWNKQAVNFVNASGSYSEFNGVSCPSALTCFMVGDSTVLATDAMTGLAFKTVNGGLNWTLMAMPSSVSSSQSNFQSISCVSVNICWISGYKILYTSDGGSTWSIQASPGNGYDGISCSNTLNCVAIGSNLQGGGSIVVSTSNGGATWNLENIPSIMHGTPLFSLYCASTLECFTSGIYGEYGGLGNNGSAMMFSTYNGGSTWITDSIPPSSAVGSIDCTSLTYCIAGGYTGPGLYSVIPGNSNGIIDITSNGGNTWQQVKMPSSSLAIGAIGCESVSYCLATSINSSGSDSTLLKSIDGGSSWSTIQTIGSGSVVISQIAFDQGGVSWLVGDSNVIDPTQAVETLYSNLS